MNPHLNKSTSPLSFIKTAIHQRELIIALIKRDIEGRYQGSIIGSMWSFVNPMVMLAVYTFVFSFVFKSRWPGGSESKTEFALILFAGLLIYNMFSECINRAPTLILANANYVKKVIFPLEVLPLVTLGTALFHMLISFSVWVAFCFVFFGSPHFTIFLFPFLLVPLMFITLGLSLFLSSIGVYLRDVGQIIMLVTTVLMFLSPIFYPVSVLPEKYRIFMSLNPLTFIIEQARGVMILGHGIDWMQWLVWTVVSMVISSLGFIWFQKTRKGFADVL